MSGYLITFASTHDGIAARKALRACCACTVLPTPRAISSGCGIAALVPESALEAARGVLDALGLGPERAVLYRVTHAGGAEHYERLQ